MAMIWNCRENEAYIQKYFQYRIKQTGLFGFMGIEEDQNVYSRLFGAKKKQTILFQNLQDQ